MPKQKTVFPVLVACVVASSLLPLFARIPQAPKQSAKKAEAKSTPARTSAAATFGDWTDWRGPNRDGLSAETGLPEKWTLNGAGMLWKAPYGGRSSPVVMGDHLYLQNAVGKGAEEQERIVCLNADTGKLIWEYRFNISNSDVPPHRVGWSSPVIDPDTGNVYAQGVSGRLLALTPQGKLIWEFALNEEEGWITTHGGRTVSPIIDGNLVIISGMSFSWGAGASPAANQARGTYRFIAFDKKTGEMVYMSTPAGRPYDTTYAPPMVADVNGTRLLIQGAADGAVHAIKVWTGEPVWKWEISKRGINTAVVMDGNNAIITHSEENLDTNEMGMMASIDAGAKGVIGPQQIRWKTNGFLGGYSSPVFDGKRIYQLDNGAELAAFDPATGKELWGHKLGTIQKASPVVADGKIYVGTENGRFVILRPGNDKPEVLSDVQLGTEEDPERMYGGAAVSRGRVYFISQMATYAIGKKKAPTGNPPKVSEKPAPGEPVLVQVVPSELALKPGDSAHLIARLFDAKGNFVKESTATWSLEGLGGSVDASGNYASTTDKKAQVGAIKATIGNLMGTARARIIPLPPLDENFDSMAVKSVPSHWVNAGAKYEVVEFEGGKVLRKISENENSFFRRARCFIGPVNWSNYTIESDVRAGLRRRQMGDVGIVAQRFNLILFGNHQRVELQAWEPEAERIVKAEFPWKQDTWYRMKLEVENLPNGKVRARGKVWLRGEPEPAAWMVEKIEALADHAGAPGLYGDAPADIYYDNLKVYSNKQ
ncbi:MAG: PQQ-binding-like beta-propeller repeat protein [Acidobacteria bacterium]|nr:PQQ-binding-like beta-propeller repeat protein [Acidobacteriota bacterium]